MLPQDYYIHIFFQLRGGGTRPEQLTHYAGGPHTSRLDAYKRAVLDALRRAPPPDVNGIYCQVFAYHGFPVNNWVQTASETIPL